MKKLLTLLLLGPALCAQAQTSVLPQSNEVWTQFSVKQKADEYRYGYKDASGHVRLPARFGDFTNAQKFRHIMAVNESATFKQYYLLKNGRQVGRDSVYMFDYTFDCENEGKIRFKDRRKDRVGFFNSQGKVIIPAQYNYITPFYNGLAVALIGARSKCWSGEKDTLQCEHPGWVGGRTVLLNERNEILVDSLPEGQLHTVNWYSLKINQAAPDTATTVSWRAANGDQYTFTDYQKEFTHWLYAEFIPAVRTGSADKVAPLCFTELAVAAKPFRGWPHFEQAAFVQKFYRPVLLPKLGGLQVGAKNVGISPEEFNQFIFNGPRFQPFFTDCGAPFQAKYPAFTVYINYAATSGKRGDETQQSYAFIRTAQGYRLFSVAL